MVEVPGGVAVNKFVVGAVIGVLLSSAELALAADDIMPTKAPPPAAPLAYDWTGFYLGAHVGYALGGSNWSATQAGGPNLSGSLSFSNAYNFSTRHRQLSCSDSRPVTTICPPRVGSLGVEADVSFPSFVGGNTTVSLGADRRGELSRTRSSSPAACAPASVMRQILAATSNWLFYATGGFAFSYDQFTRTQLAGFPVGGTAVPGTVENLFLVPRVGGVVGVGVELALDAALDGAARISVHRLWHAQRDVPGRRPAVRFRSYALRSLRVGLDYQLGRDGVDPEILTNGTVGARPRLISLFTARRLSSSNTIRRSARPISGRIASIRTRGARAGTPWLLSAPGCGRAPSFGSIRKSIRALA